MSDLIVRKAHTGEPGNPGQFGSRHRDEAPVQLTTAKYELLSDIVDDAIRSNYGQDDDDSRDTSAILDQALADGIDGDDVRGLLNGVAEATLDKVSAGAGPQNAVAQALRDAYGDADDNLTFLRAAFDDGDVTFEWFKQQIGRAVLLGAAATPTDQQRPISGIADAAVARAWAEAGHPPIDADDDLPDGFAAAQSAAVYAAQIATGRDE